MHLSPPHDETPTNPAHEDKSLAALIDTCRDKDGALRRDHIICSLLEDVPKSFPKLLSKDILLREPTQQQRERSNNRAFSQNTLDGRAKQTQKSFFKALEQEHRIINRDNMQMLGLTIQKMSYSQKNKKGSCCELIPEHTTYGLTPELLNFENTENMLYNDSFLGKKMQFNPSHPTRVSSSKRPQSIRVRDKSSPKNDKRRRSVKPVNSEYTNPIYDARISSYRELLFRLHWSYGHYYDMQQPEEEGTARDRRLKAWIGGGNNSPLVRQLIKRRFWWQIVEERSLDVNFVWTQLKVNDYFKKQPSAPIYFLQEKRKPTEPISKQLGKETAKEITVRRSKPKKEDRYKDDEFLFKLMPEFERANFLSSIKNLRGKELWERQQILKLSEQRNEQQKMHNHLTNNFYLGNKKALFYNLKEYYELTGGHLFKVIPLTFHIKKGMRDPQYKRFLVYHKKRHSIIRKQEKDKENGLNIGRPMRNIWIVKPGELTNRGNGITVIDQVYELDAIMKSEGKHENGTEKTFIVQLYIDRPFLYKKRKFDIRHYLMVSQLNGVFKAYWYKEGYIRTASYEFDVFNFEREIHLTNDAVQKYTPLYGRHEPANKLSYTEFQKYLDATYPKDNYNFEERILPKMKAIGLDAVRSAFVKLSPERYKHNFEIFGLDFMIDSEFNPWLIEINTNPCLELACPLLCRIIPQMLDQALRLTLDVIYPPPCHYPNTAKHLVPDASLESLRFDLIFDERVDGGQLRNLYKKCKSNLLQQIGDISDDQVYQDCNPNPLQLEEIL